MLGQLHAFNSHLLALFALQHGTWNPHGVFVPTGDIDFLDGELKLFLFSLFLGGLVLR